MLVVGTRNKAAGYITGSCSTYTASTGSLNMMNLSKEGRCLAFPQVQSGLAKVVLR